MENTSIIRPTISTYRIYCGLGRSSNWEKHFSDSICEDLNEIGYSGKLNGVKMTINEFFNICPLIPANVAYRAETISSDCGEGSEVLTLIKVEF